MDIQIVVRNVDEAAALRALAAEELGRALERFEDRILGATLRLEDETGPFKSGVDKHCNIEVRLRTGEVRIKEQGETFPAVLNTALDRLRQAMRREVGKAKRGVGEG